jgi:hypothetical protein
MWFPRSAPSPSHPSLIHHYLSPTNFRPPTHSHSTLNALLSHPPFPPPRVWYKHRDNLFMPAAAELLSMLLVRAFNTALEVVYFGCIVFFMVGYTRTAGGLGGGTGGSCVWCGCGCGCIV